MWYQIELPQPTTIAEIIVDASMGGGFAGFGGRGTGGMPAFGMSAYRLHVSMDGTTWSPPVAQGRGETPSTQMTFAPVPAKFVRITQTGTARNNEWWGVQQVRIYQTPVTAR